MIVGIRSYRHVGDSMFLTGAVRNVRLQYPAIKFRFCGREEYYDLFKHNDDWVWDDEMDMVLPLVSYGTRYEESHALKGTFIESYTKTVCNALGIPPVPISVNTPVFTLTDEEIAWGVANFAGKWLLNANCQSCSMSKWYPYWSLVAEGMVNMGLKVCQLGGTDERDISTNNIVGVEDWRRKTNLRQFLSAIYACDGIVTPPSAIMNASSYFGKPCIVVMGCREPVEVSNYPNCMYIRSTCDHENCLAQKVEQCFHWKDGAQCQRNIHPNVVLEHVKYVLEHPKR